MSVVAKQGREKHFTKSFVGGTVSHRVILPGPDDCPIKVTKFVPKEGFSPGEVRHNTDEFVYVLEGEIEIEFILECSKHVLRTGGSYYVPAGTGTKFRALEDSLVLCVFFRGDDGKLPEND